MIRVSGLLLALCVAGVGVAVQAEPASLAGDRAYCEKLSELYIRYIGHDNSNGSNFLRRGSTDAQVATTHCQIDTASAIPILERQLLANKFTLPKRG